MGLMHGMRAAATSAPVTTAASVAGMREESLQGRRSVRTWGSVSALPGGGDDLPALPQLAFDVPEGAARVRAVFYLYGGERVRVALTDPAGRVEVQETQARPGLDGQAVFDLVVPAPGRWVLEAAMAEPAVLRCWAAEAEVEG